ncbi:MAG TPA: hypothetical protein DCY88_28725 [Cyanobacteria bacterium UBA11372]|nr:hypothetical protein [Cyanobacteria bacterium UBA11372]
MNKIYFYAPDEEKVELMKKDYSKWSGDFGNFGWIAPTYFYLKAAGFTCEIATRVPEEGILLADRDTLGDGQKDLNKVMLICAKGDREFHPYAHLHIVQNPVEFNRKKNSIWRPYYIPFWPQPELVPRAKERNYLVENVAYIGAESQLAKELKSERWIKYLEDLGCKWLPIFDKKKWNNYRNIDLVVAARSFDKITYTNKPASKLINCWRAGVPAILTPETAFLAERKTELDFLIVESLEEAIAAVKKLKSDPELYGAMVENCLKRAEEFTTEKTVEQWVTFFNQVAFPAYEEWRKTSEPQKEILFFLRSIRLKLHRMTVIIKGKLK